MFGSDNFRAASSRLLELLPSQLRKRKPSKPSLVYEPARDSWSYVSPPEVSGSLPGASARNLEADNFSTEDLWGFNVKIGQPFRWLLVILAVASSAISFAVDRVVGLLEALRPQVLAALGGVASPFGVEAGFDVLLVCCARLLVQLAPQAAGSGIPEVKCILSGLPMTDFLRRRVLVAKAAGLALSIGGSLPVGKEGPFVHVASCVSQSLLNSRFFKSAQLPQEEVLLAAAAVGVGATFSAPVGGVLFALELMMPHLYDTGSYAACFFASTMGTLTFMVLNMILRGGGITPLFNSDISPSDTALVTLAQELVFILLCMLMGGVCGAAGGLFVHCHRKAAGAVSLLRGLRPGGAKGQERAEGPRGLRRRLAGPSLARDLLLMALVALAGAAVKTYGGTPLLRTNVGPLLTELFSKKHASEELQSLALLSWLFVLKWFHTALALALPVPAGCVAPSLVLGAVMGRVFAACLPDELRTFLAPDGDFSSYEARFAIVSATTFCGSVCRVISVVVTVFELIAVPRLILPLALATLTANYCSAKVGPSIFDSILVMKKIPAMPTLAASHQALRLVSEVLRPNLLDLALPRWTSGGDLERAQGLLGEIAAEGKSTPSILPIVEEVVRGDKVLCGAVKVSYLKDLQRLIAECPSDRFQPGAQGSGSPGRADLLRIVVARRLLVSPLQVEPETTLKQAYLEAQSSSREGPMMVVDGGVLMGILPHEDLLKLGDA